MAVTCTGLLSACRMAVLGQADVFGLVGYSERASFLVAQVHRDDRISIYMKLEAGYTQSMTDTRRQE